MAHLPTPFPTQWILCLRIEVGEATHLLRLQIGQITLTPEVWIWVNIQIRQFPAWKSLITTLQHVMLKQTSVWHVFIHSQTSMWCLCAGPVALQQGNACASNLLFPPGARVCLESQGCRNSGFACNVKSLSLRFQEVQTRLKVVK